MCLLTRCAFQFMYINSFFLETKEQDSCLESQGVHAAAEPVFHGSV